MPAFVDTGLNLVHVEDVAEGHILAFEKGQVGARYILGGEDLTLEQILQRIAALTGGKAPTVKLPHGAILPLAYVVEAFARLFRTGEPFITVDGIKLARKRMFFSSAKAARELGYRARPVDEALADAIAWFRAHQVL
jgi:dihydroflavonol-4-reductase